MEARVPPPAPRQIRLIAVGGLDPSGGAGLVRDFLTARAWSANSILVTTAVTTQTSQAVLGIEPRPANRVHDALALALRGAPAGTIAVKVGMVATTEIVAAIVDALDGFEGPVVFDPVLRASSGGSLFAGAPADLLPLGRRASIMTPNADEAAALSGRPAGTVQEGVSAAAELRRLGARAVLLKGGHFQGEADATDILSTPGGERLFRAPRLPGKSPRGTGCALATAIAVELAGGRPLDEAVSGAKTWLHEQIRNARQDGDGRVL